MQNHEIINHFLIKASKKNIQTKLKLFLEFDQLIFDFIFNIHDPIICLIRINWWHDQLTKLSKNEQKIIYQSPVLKKIRENFSNFEILSLIDITNYYSYIIENLEKLNSDILFNQSINKISQIKINFFKIDNNNNNKLIFEFYELIRFKANLYLINDKNENKFNLNKNILIQIEDILKTYYLKSKNIKFSSAHLNLLKLACIHIFKNISLKNTKYNPGLLYLKLACKLLVIKFTLFFKI